jgi:2-polyprenyl-6-methoxyphenol hydroxylase-like FAD-dependent oxidoreductase
MALATEKYAHLVRFHFETRIAAVDVQAGTLTHATPSGETVTETFGFVVGGDGAGSIVRRALCDQVPGYTVESKSFPNYCTMIELDRVGGDMDRNYLHGLSVRPFCVAGAIKGDRGGDTSRWFCAVGTKAKQTFRSTDEARDFFRSRVPRILQLASEEKVAAYAQRPCYHIGQTLTCSALYGGNAVLLGDAAAAFPPIGQGVNAAMESAMALDLAIGEGALTQAGLRESAALYSARWKPEADAVSWMSVRSLFENRFHMMRASITSKLGLSIFDDAKSVDVPYSTVRHKAERLWPLWA